MPEAGTQTRWAHAGSGGPDCAEWDRQTRKLDDACPEGAAGRVAGGEWQMVDGGGQMAEAWRMTSTG